MAPAFVRYRCSRTHRQPYPPVAQEQEFVLCDEEAVGGRSDLLYVRFSFFVVFGKGDDEKCSAIFAVTLVLTIMIVAAPPGIKNITAQYALLFAFLLILLNAQLDLNSCKPFISLPSNQSSPSR